jgi:uncharacterized protein (TIGR03086 family)
VKEIAVSTAADPTVVELHTRAVEAFRALVHQIPAHAWASRTPCSDWDVRALVNHVVGEELWTVPLLEGQTIAEVGDRFDGDLLGLVAADVADGAAKGAVAAFEESGAAERTVALSIGATPASEYAMQLIADHAVHGWDLAVAIGAGAAIDGDILAVLTGWYADREDLYRGAGIVADRPPVPASSVQDELLVAFGRDPAWGPPE